MIQVRILASKLLKAKEVRRLCQKFFTVAKTEEGMREIEEYDEWIRNVIEVNRTYLEVKEKTANDDQSLTA